MLGIYPEAQASLAHQPERLLHLKTVFCTGAATTDNPALSDSGCPSKKERNNAAWEKKNREEWLASYARK